jgi:hypothetical protein
VAIVHRAWMCPKPNGSLDVVTLDLGLVLRTDFSARFRPLWEGPFVCAMAGAAVAPGAAARSGGHSPAAADSDAPFQLEMLDGARRQYTKDVSRSLSHPSF